MNISLINIPLVSHAYRAASEVCEKIQNFGINLVSPKQLVRPDSMYQSLSLAWPSIKVTAVSNLWKPLYCFSECLHLNFTREFQKQIKAVEILYEINNRLKTEPLNDEEKALLKQFFADASTDPHFFQHLQPYFVYSKKENLGRFFSQCNILFKPLFEDPIPNLKDKIDAIQKVLGESSDELFPVEKKLVPRDFMFLFHAKGSLNLLEALKQLNLPKKEALIEKWKALSEINQSQPLQQLREICLNDCTEGKIYVGDRFVRCMVRDAKLDFKGILKQLSVGRINHMAILVKDDQGKTAVSHVETEGKTHTITPLTDPLFQAFLYKLDLDISPLFPECVSTGHLFMLRTTFKESFLRHAKEKHLDVPSASWNSYLRMVFLGHKSLFRQPLSEVAFKPGQAELCSSYVAKVFLLAIQDVNKEMANLGYTESIPHPFGEHEVIELMDSLRLIYQWKRNQVCRLVPIHPTIAKVIKVADWL